MSEFDYYDEVEAPREIWAGEDAVFTRRWRHNDERGGARYVRGDIASDMLAALKGFVQLDSGREIYPDSMMGQAIEAIARAEGK